MASPADEPPTRPCTRRVLLAAGSALLLSGCAGRLTGVPPGYPLSLAAPGARGTSPVRPVHTKQPRSPSAAPRRHAGRPEFYVADGPRAIALTLDDGPDPEWTPRILALLRRYGITAAFSQVGENVRAYPQVARSVAAEGHPIVNHTWTHADLARLSPGGVQAQIERTSDEIEQIAGCRPTLFRAPYGAWTRPTFATCRDLGLRTLDWSVDPRDWARPGTGTIVQRILRHTRAGSIILEHDGGGDRSQTVAALSTVIPALLDQGYHFVAP